ncbi:MAG: hypothetical protein ABIJ21_05760 [Nanoarchaeota archaeon]
MEVLGLTMIIVLFLLGIGLLVFFGRPKGASFITEYNQKLAGSFVTIIPDVKMECLEYDVRMAEYIRACATDGSIACAGDGTEATCAALETALETALANSLDVWGYEYELSLSRTTIDISNHGEVVCEDKPRRVVGEQPLPISAMGGDPVIIRLSLCY